MFVIGELLGATSSDSYHSNKWSGWWCKNMGAFLWTWAHHGWPEICKFSCYNYKHL